MKSSIGSTETLITGAKSLEMVKRKPWKKRTARLILFLIVVAGLILWFVPWQQTIIGSGEVIVFDAMQRPQTVEAQIPGRITKWLVNEGQTVRAGDQIAEIEDIESRFLAPDQVARFTRQVQGLQNARNSELERIAEIQNQISQAVISQTQRQKNASETFAQSLERRKISMQILRASQQNLKIAQRVAKLSANERLAQANDAVKQAEQSVTAAKQKLALDKIQRARVKELFAKGLESQRADEVSETELVTSQTNVERAQLALEIAKRTASIGTLTVDQANLEIERAKAAVDQASASVAVADRDVKTAENNIDDIRANTEERVASLQASLRAGEATVSRLESDLEARGIDLSQLEQRRGQTIIKAPATGRVVRLMKVGAGSTVKAGDVLATIVPDTQDRAVELMVTDNDVSFLRVGAEVRLQFAGYPALQFSGAPGVSFGTYGGRIAFIDPVDDGSARFRVVIKEAQHELLYGRKDDAWPRPERLRPGAEAVGWMMLDRVPIWFELWRQFNGFPPKMGESQDPRVSMKEDKGGSSKGKKADKADKSDYLSPDILIKSKK